MRVLLNDCERGFRYEFYVEKEIVFIIGRYGLIQFKKSEFLKLLNLLEDKK